MKQYLRMLAILILAALPLVLSACDITITPSGSAGTNPISTVGATASSGTSGSVALGKRTKTAGCVAHNGLPDSACTPGAIFASATVQEICTSGYASSVRNVPYSEADDVYAEYGIYHHSYGQYEDDHLVPLELGGSNDIANLWPEAASPTPGFHQKDEVENYLHDQVCSGALALKDAQQEIATNWLAVYNRMPK
ncbi:MAG TPA: HNH endonuclease [Ktedonobacteraceae bacterium]|nr:HNH endonuclease [Ktedonobacteraceae bacterium]